MCLFACQHDLVRLDDIDLAEPGGRTSMADGIDLHGFAFAVAIRSIHLPIASVRDGVAGLPEIRGAGLIGYLREHPRFLAALDFPERIATELKVVTLLVYGVTPAA